MGARPAQLSGAWKKFREARIAQHQHAGPVEHGEPVAHFGERESHEVVVALGLGFTAPPLGDVTGDAGDADDFTVSVAQGGTRGGDAKLASIGQADQFLDLAQREAGVDQFGLGLIDFGDPLGRHDIGFVLARHVLRRGKAEEVGNGGVHRNVPVVHVLDEEEVRGLSDGGLQQMPLGGEALAEQKHLRADQCRGSGQQQHEHEGGCRVLVEQHARHGQEADRIHQPDQCGKHQPLDARIGAAAQAEIEQLADTDAGDDGDQDRPGGDDIDRNLHAGSDGTGDDDDQRFAEKGNHRQQHDPQVEMGLTLEHDDRQDNCRGRAQAQSDGKQRRAVAGLARLQRLLGMYPERKRQRHDGNVGNHRFEHVRPYSQTSGNIAF